MFWPFKRGEPQIGQFTSAARDEFFSAIFFDFEFRLKNAKYESAKIIRRIAANKRINSIKSL